MGQHPSYVHTKDYVGTDGRADGQASTTHDERHSRTNRREWGPSKFQKRTRAPFASRIKGSIVILSASVDTIVVVQATKFCLDKFTVVLRCQVSVKLSVGLRSAPSGN